MFRLVGNGLIQRAQRHSQRGSSCCKTRYELWTRRYLDDSSSDAAFVLCLATKADIQFAKYAWIRTLSSLLFMDSASIETLIFWLAMCNLSPCGPWDRAGACHWEQAYSDSVSRFTEHVMFCSTELSMRQFCVTRSNPTHQLTEPTQPTASGKIWTQPDPTQFYCLVQLQSNLIEPCFKCINITLSKFLILLL